MAVRLSRSTIFRPALDDWTARAPDGGLRTVLLVQPERHDRDWYGAALRGAGLVAIDVSTAADALRIAGRVDLVVTALLLPGPMDGLALIAQLKRDARTAHIPVIALTRCAWTSEREQARALGCDLFLAKPCPLDVFARQTVRLAHDAVRRRQRGWDWP